LLKRRVKKTKEALRAEDKGWHNMKGREKRRASRREIVASLSLYTKS